MENRPARNENAEPRGTPSNVRWLMVRLWVPAALVIICLFLNACLRKEDGCTEEYFAQHPEQCRYIVGVRMDNSRFEFPPPTGSMPSPLRPSRDFWLRSGDELFLRWSQYSITFNNPAVTCDLSSDPLPAGPDCDICFACNSAGVDCHHQTEFTAGSRPELHRFDGFMMESAPAVEALGPQAGCTAGHHFTPPGNATYQLLKYANTMPPIVETKVFVLESGGVGQRVTYPLSPLAQTTQDAVFYSGTVPGSPLLEDNFSAGLHITRVRVLKGTASRDPVTGKLQIANASLAHPSRIVLISMYDGSADIYPGRIDGIRCYANESADGDIDFTRCRAALTMPRPCTGNSSDEPSCRLPATPISLAGSPNPLTWIAEFKPSEGGIIPVFESSEILAIEFTIEAN